MSKLNTTSVKIAFIALGLILFLAGLFATSTKSFLSVILPIAYLTGGLILIAEIGFNVVLSKQVKNLGAFKMFGLVYGVVMVLSGLLLAIAQVTPLGVAGWIVTVSGFPLMLLGGMIFAEAFLVK